MDSESIISIPKIASRKLDNRGSIQGKIGGLGKRSRTLQSITASNLEEMTIPGRFILLYAANIFISGDYEYCLSICKHNFSFFTNTSLFEGNILRFKSLAAERLFQYNNAYPNPQERSSFVDRSQQFKQMENLFLSIESAKNALEIYRDRISQGDPCPNHYGMALQQYQLGYLYDKYADILSSE